MQAVGGILGNLKNMAQDMGDEIGRQNKQLDTIGGKVIISYFFMFLTVSYPVCGTMKYLDLIFTIEKTITTVMLD